MTTDAKLKAECEEPVWIAVMERLPEDGEVVNVMLERSREIRAACRGEYCRGEYESTGAWFDAITHRPIYDSIGHWTARN